MEQINEKSSGSFEVEFEDEGGELSAPSSVTWILNDLRTGTEIVTGTINNPSSTETIEISSDDNAIINEDHDKETKQLIVTAVFGDGKEITQEFKYKVVNFRHFS